MAAFSTSWKGPSPRAASHVYSLSLVQTLSLRVGSESMSRPSITMSFLLVSRYRICVHTQSSGREAIPRLTLVGCTRYPALRPRAHEHHATICPYSQDAYALPSY